MIKDQIINALQKATSQKEIQLSTPEIEEHGDFSTNIALISAKKNGKSARELAEQIRQKLQSDKLLLNFIEKIEVAGPGFINFYLKQDYLVRNLLEIGESYGENSLGKGKKIIVEYSSPNIAKPFTIGHLRSTIIGDAIANLLESCGFTVYRDNHLGDWGTQFGKQIYAIKTWGDIDKIAKSKEPIKELVALYIKFHKEAEKDPTIERQAREWFKKLEDGDSEARSLWKKCIDWSLKEFSTLYDKLGIKFTENGGVGYGESFFEDRMPAVVRELKKAKLLKESKGAKLIFFPKDKYPPLMIIKSDGTTLYATRDLATDKFRLSHYGKDVVVINETGTEQDLYWKQVFQTEYMLGWYKPGQRIHIGHGLVRFKEGKMSTRKGNVIWLTQVIDEAFERAKKLGSETKELAEMVGIGAIKWNDLKREPKQEVTFDWDEILNMQGNSGPYLQYTHARIKSVLVKGVKIKKNDNGRESTLYPEELTLLKAIVNFPEIVKESAINYSPNTLCNYLYALAQKYNNFYNKHKIIGSQKEEFRLKLTEVTGIVIKNGLNLLGIEAPQKM